MMKGYFAQKGWKLLNDFEESGLNGTYEVTNQSIRWTLKHIDPSIPIVEIEFTLMRHMGEYTEDVNDISWCEIPDTSNFLSFSKINSNLWKIAHKEFIDSLINIKPI
jgi:hypothetical protein